MWHNQFGPNPPAPFPGREGGVSSPFRFGEGQGERSENRSIRKFCKMYLTTTQSEEFRSLEILPSTYDGTTVLAGNLMQKNAPVSFRVFPRLT